MTPSDQDRELRMRTYLVPIGELHPWPERPVRPEAIIVHPDAATRLTLGARLRSAGYEVTTCPGPGRACCPAVSSHEGRDDERCPRVPEHLALLVVDERMSMTPLPDNYRRWHPQVQIRPVGEHADPPAMTTAEPAHT